MMKLYFMLVRRIPPEESPVLREVFSTLRRRGFEIESGIAEELVSLPDRLAPSHDLYVLKSHTQLSLSIAGVLDSQGARILNPYASCAATQNKIVASRRLAAAGVPAPRCWVTGDLALMRSIAEKRPLIIKPYLGHRGAGIHIVRDPDQLGAVAPEGPVLIQEYVQGSGEDLKVYVVGDRVFAVRKAFSPTSFAQPGRACSVDSAVRDIALRCGKAFGLGLYGLDVIESPDGPVVVDLNFFPGYKGVQGVAPLIAEYIEAYAHERQCQLVPESDSDRQRENLACEVPE
ncbi:MAG: ATP-grasp domain-containing protein [Betaproteobacteria bacterium]|nr:ATP-grasp domain-containing protein [Betaproteobacteria bacterium]